MQLNTVRRMPFVVLALVAFNATAQPKAATFADAVAILDQARDATNASIELGLTKRAWAILQQIAIAQPASEVAIKFAARDSIGRINLASVYETLCLLEPTAPCLAELAWGKRDAALKNQISQRQKDPFDPAYSIGQALADLGHFQLTRTYATRVGPAKADVRRSMFRSATEAESRLLGRDRAAQSLALIAEPDDRKAATEGLPLVPSSQQRNSLQLAVHASSTEADTIKRTQRLIEIMATQLRLGFGDDVRATVEVLLSSTSEKASESTTLSALRVASIALYLTGDKVGSREALVRLCNFPEPSEKQWILSPEKRAAMILVECGIAQALTDNPQTATETALRAPAFERSVVMSYLLEPMLRREQFVEAFASARVMNDQFRDPAIQFVFSTAIAKGRRAEALEFARTLTKTERRAMALLIMAKRDLDLNHRSEAKAILEEAGQLASGMYEDEEWRVARAILYARMGDATTASTILKAEAEKVFKDQRKYRLRHIVAAAGMLGLFGEARRIIASIDNAEDQVDTLIYYSIGVAGCVSGLSLRWGTKCKEEWQMSNSYFPKKAIQWGTW